MFFWIAGKKYVETQVNKGRETKFTKMYYPICKYIYVPICILVLVLGIALGGIGYILAAIFSYMKANKLSSKKSYEIARKDI